MENTVKEPNDELLKALKCPRCSHYMVPPISFCENGHNICNNCKSELNRCPECKQPFLRGTNKTLENIARQIEYPCNFRDQGCQEMLTVDTISEHQEDCRYGLYKCPVLLTGRKRCPWKGPLPEMKVHLNDEHAEDVWEGTGPYKKKQTMVSPSGLYNNVMLTLGEIFYVQFRGQDGNFYGVGKYIGPRKNAKNYWCRILLSSKNGDEMVMAQYITRDFKEETEEIIKTGKCLKFHYDVVRKLLDQDNSLKVKVEISETVKA